MGTYSGRHGQIFNIQPLFLKFCELSLFQNSSSKAHFLVPKIFRESEKLYNFFCHM